MTTIFRKGLAVILTLSFALNTTLPAYAQGARIFTLPAAGEQVALSPVFVPPMLKAVKVNPHNPFQFDFIVDQGSLNLQADDLKNESQKLFRYFLASLTTPENDLWVNLSPYEKNRIIAQSFGTTEMGRDLLAQDYLLKQIAATLLYPEKEIGKKFWDKVKMNLFKKFGTTDIPTDTFNKVWIVPQKAVVYENGASAYVDETHLKVMLDEDLTPLSPLFKKAGESVGRQLTPSVDTRGPRPDGLGAPSDVAQRSSVGILKNNISAQILRELIIPELQKEVNEGKNFAPLRQIYNSLILANWYKKRLKDSILSQIYVDKNKVDGVDIDDREEAKKIYDQYVEAFKKGVYNYIKEDYDSLTQETVPRKYFSGGMGLAGAGVMTEYRAGLPTKVSVVSSNLYEIVVNLDFSNGQSPIKKAGSSQVADVIEPGDPLLQINRIKADKRQEAVELLFRQFFEDNFYKSRYVMSKKLVYEHRWRESENTAILLPQFIDEVFRRALMLGDVKSTKIVFLKAGAQPLYDATQLMAKISGIFPEGNIKSVWATMNNHNSMQADPEQAVLFIKYLYDQGVLTSETKHLLVVDTDTGLGSPGTELIFAETLLNNDVIYKVNRRFGLDIQPFNEEGSENSLDLFYMNSTYHSVPGLFESYMNYARVPVPIRAKLRISGFSAEDFRSSKISRYIADLWSHVDRFVKTENIDGRFVLTGEGKVIVNPRPVFGQLSSDIEELRLVRISEDTGLLMGVLDVLEGRGFDVTEEADELVAKLENILRTGGLSMTDIDASKPQPGYRASSSLIPVSSAENVNNLGGIDLTAAKTPLDIRSQGESVEFNFNPQYLQSLQFDGLVPVIINIVPVVNLPQFLTGKSFFKSAPQLSRTN